MRVDSYGVPHATADELANLLYESPLIDLTGINVDDPEEFNRSVKSLFSDIAPLQKYVAPDVSVEEFDAQNQQKWLMPDEYKTLDIAKWLLEQCKTEEELQRVGKELLMYQERDMMDLLRFMKYFVDRMRERNLVWGVGRGSSISSYVLFLLQVHRIDSIYYDLDPAEFLK